MLDIRSSAADRGSQIAKYEVIKLKFMRSKNLYNYQQFLSEPFAYAPGYPRAARVSPLTLAAGNVSSLLDNPRSNRPERRTELVAWELARYKVNIAELSETRFPSMANWSWVPATSSSEVATTCRAMRRQRRHCHPEQHRGTSALSAAGHQSSPDEPTPASSGR
ncbi:unnamed protein product [Schistocephalus solidus]|uniref:Cilia- and flagella-associated protein 299 n=1 Tax=Schistocephalus solidus TaxID=70667 RepID=A0A183TI21_SCHSO|nr:unnamed protein product [Schistocephalus solidus]